MKKHLICPGDSLASIAACYNTDYQTLQTLNNLKGFTIYIGDYLFVPSNRADEQQNDYGKDEPQPYPTTEPPLTTARGEIVEFSATNTYTVKAGDNLLRIANQFGTTPDVLRQLNNLSNNNIFIGQILRLPNTNANSNDNKGPQAPETYIVKPGDTLNVLAWIFGLSAETIKTLNKLKTETLTPGQVLILRQSSTPPPPIPDNNHPPVPLGDAVYYTVAAGDTFFKIAQKFGIKIEDILAWNKLSGNSTLSIGQKLIVGKKNDQNQSEQNNKNDGDNNNGTPQNVVYTYYTVAAGDTFFKIAQKFGIKIEDILAWNKLSGNATLSIGQKLIVGKKNDQNQSEQNNDNNPKQDETPNKDSDTSSSKTVDSGSFTVVNQPLKPDIKFIISNTVGLSGQNIGQDVKVIQAQLIRAGFLSSKDENNEIPPSNQTKMSMEVLPKTIAAIKAFQADIVGMVTPSGLIRPEDTTHQFLNTFILPPTAERFETIKEAIKAINIRINSGREELATAFSAPVGQTEAGNTAEDVKKVQIALAQLNMLSLSHGETPAPNSAVSPNKIPRTIEAIKRFQRLKVNNLTGIPALFGNSTYTTGIIGANDKDFSFKILRDYIEYLVSFTNPGNPNAQVNISFHNFINSKHTIYPDGVGYMGAVMTNLPLKEYEALGLNKLQAEALRFVSTHEGNFDAVNSYDKANFSYGFIQFAGNNSTGGLAPMLALMKINRPETFRRYFQQYGIDVEYAILKGEISRANLTAVHPLNGKLLRKSEAEICVKNFKTITSIFIRAAYNLDVQRAQIEAAKRMFVGPAFNIEADFKIRVIRTLGPDRKTPVVVYVGTKADQYRLKDEYTILKNADRIEEEMLDFGGQPLTDIIRSEKGLTALLDISVNKWTIEARSQFVNAITQIAADKSLDSKEKICAVDEKLVLAQIAKVLGNSQLKDRIENILTSTDLSSAK